MIIHLDMDAFYASVEIRENPELAGLPVVVGGSSKSRGVVAAASYAARKFGIHSAMPMSQASRLCPDLVCLPGNMQLYASVSKQIHEIFNRYTPEIEPLSLDEAFLDVTGTQECFGSATWLAEKIRKEIYERTQLTASAGVASNKFLAKIASDWNKPNGQFVIPPEAIAEFMLDLQVGKIFGVGKVTLKKLNNLGVETCADLQKLDLITLSNHFGIFGQRLFELCRGHDERELHHDRPEPAMRDELVPPAPQVGP